MNLTLNKYILYHVFCGCHGHSMKQKYISSHMAMTSLLLLPYLAALQASGCLKGSSSAHYYCHDRKKSDKHASICSIQEPQALNFNTPDCVKYR